MLKYLIQDRLLILAGLNALIAIAAGFFLIPPIPALYVVKHAGYWVMLLTVILFAWSLWQLARSRPAGSPVLRPGDWVLLAGCTAVLLVHEPYGFKIIMDEILLLGTSMHMHYDRLVLTPLRAHDIEGSFMLLDGYMDKRPYFFPFLLSLVHDLSGYRPENAFVLNTGLTFLFLWLAFGLGAKLSGRQGGILAVLLLTGLPLLGQNATGGGFELLNLVMILAIVHIGATFFQRRDAVSLSALCLCAVLLAQSRYESVVFIGCVALLVGWVWFLERRPILSWPAAFSPLLLLPYPLQNKIFQVKSSSWELASMEGFDQPFSLSYLPDNLAHAVSFFFDLSWVQPNSILLSAIGVCGVAFFTMHLVRAAPRLSRESPALVSWVFFSVGLGLLFLLYMTYFWGHFDAPVIRRLSLPVHLLMIFSAVAIIPRFAQAPLMWRVLQGGAAAWILVYSLPAMSKHLYTQTYTPAREIAWRREFVRQHPERDYLFIDNDTTFWITHHVSSVAVRRAVERSESLEFHQRNRTFREIFLFQRLELDDEGAWGIREGDDPGATFRLETVAERRFRPLTLSRISRVVEIVPGAEAGVPAAAHPATERVELSAEERERAKRLYYENWARQLP